VKRDAGCRTAAVAGVPLHNSTSFICHLCLACQPASLPALSLGLPRNLNCYLCAPLHPFVALQPSQSLLAARGKLEVPPQMRAQMQKTYNDSQASLVGESVGCVA
jgi:hypothetical protein